MSLNPSTAAALRNFYDSRLERLKYDAPDLDFALIDPTPVFDHPLETKNDRPMVIVGEAPGGEEVNQGKPFVGPAGANLMKLTQMTGLSRERDFLITNAFPFRTFQPSPTGVKNRTPSRRELEAGAALLVEELAILKPRMLLVLGGSARNALMKSGIPALKNAVKSMELHTVSTVELPGLEEPLTLGLTFHTSPLVFNVAPKREKLIQFFQKLRSPTP